MKGPALPSSGGRQHPPGKGGSRGMATSYHHCFVWWSFGGGVWGEGGCHRQLGVEEEYKQAGGNICVCFFLCEGPRPPLARWSPTLSLLESSKKDQPPQACKRLRLSVSLALCLSVYLLLCLSVSRSLCLSNSLSLCLSVPRLSKTRLREHAFYLSPGFVSF